MVYPDEPGYLAKKECRMCLETTHPETMIKPCMCDGPRRYIHKKCLSEWRANSRGTLDFTQCEVCQFSYWIQRKSSSVNSEEDAVRPAHKLTSKGKMKYRFLLFRDSFSALILFQLTICSIAWFIGVADNKFTTWKPVPCKTPGEGYPNTCGHVGAPGGPLLNSMPAFLAKNMKTTYYLLALSLLLSVGGFFILYQIRMHSRAAIENGSLATTHSDSAYAHCCPRYHSYGYLPTNTSSSSCDCGTCHCNSNNSGGGNCNCSGGSGDCGSAVIVILIFIALCLLMYSVFWLIIFFTSFFFKVYQRHANVLKRKTLAREYEICDLDHIDIGPDAAGKVPMSPEFDRSELSLVGLV